MSDQNIKNFASDENKTTVSSSSLHDLLVADDNPLAIDYSNHHQPPSNATINDSQQQYDDEQPYDTGEQHGAHHPSSQDADDDLASMFATPFTLGGSDNGLSSTEMMSVAATLQENDILTTLSDDARSLLESCSESDLEFALSSHMALGGGGGGNPPIPPTSVAEAVALHHHQHHMLSSTAIDTLATQLGAAAVTAGTIAVSAEKRENVTYEPSSQQQQANSSNNNNTGGSMEERTSSLVGINRSGLGISHSSQPHHHSRTSALFRAKSQRATGFLSTLVPQMQHLATELRNLSEVMSETTDYYHQYINHYSNAANPAMQSLVEGLKSSNEIRQSEAVSELAEMFLLGNEETLPTIPVVEIVQALCALLQKDDNYELMLTTVRCITNMQEALPHTLPVIAETIPLLLAKLKRIEYIDVAEQSLIALEVMSKRSGKQILAQGGIASTISHVEFFSLPSQRLCYQIAANCAIYVTPNEFHLARDYLPDLTQRLICTEDKRCIESICTFFTRIIENVRQHSDRLRQVAGPNFEFMQNMQKLLASQPSNISSNTYLALIKSLRYITAQCPDAALALVRMEFGYTIRTLIAPERNELSEGNSVESGEKTAVDLNSRPALHVKEIIALIGQLIENLPRGCEEVINLMHLFPLLVEIGSNSSCAQLRNESLSVMRSMVKMVDKVDHLEPILRDIPLAVYITQMLSSNKNLGVLLASLQLSRILLAKLPRLYIPLFEAEGVFHEISRLTTPIDSPFVDRKPPMHTAMAEQILEGLVVNSSSGEDPDVRVIIPPIYIAQESAGAQAHQEILKNQQQMVCKEAKYILDKFAGEQAAKKYRIKEPNRAKSLFAKLELLAGKIRNGNDHGDEVMAELRDLLLEQEITSFQFNQSGIPSALIAYLTESHHHPPRDIRLKRFASIFMGIDEKQPNMDSIGAEQRCLPFEKLVAKLLQTIGNVEQFQVRMTNLSGIISNGSGSSLASYQSALMRGSGANPALFTTSLRGAQALRFFQTHQIRVNLRLHPKCKNLREWRHSRVSIKIDPFTSVSSIERYLLERGIGVPGGQQQLPSEEGDDDSEKIRSYYLDDESDEDQDLSFSSGLSNDGRIELYIGEHLLPSDISILQAIRQFSLPNGDDDSIETIPSSIWLRGHTIYYCNPTSEGHSAAEVAAEQFKNSPTSAISEEAKRMQEPETISTSRAARVRLETQKANSSSIDAKKKSKSDSTLSSAAGGCKDNSIYKIGKPPTRPSPLDAYLKVKGTAAADAIDDQSISCLALLHILYGLNSYWWQLYFSAPEEQIALPASHTSLILQSSFMSTKLNSKVTRQLSDFLTVATSQIPKWTTDLMNQFPFVFSFSTRRSFLFCTSFGLDRALMHLVSEANADDGQEGAGHDATSRLIPRLERRKVSIKRDNILKEAQQIFTQMGTSRAMLEVGFEGEVGTGFGPTLEFYSTLSRALQKRSLRLWSGTVRKCPEEERDGSGDDDYVYAANGLYPQMRARLLSPDEQNDVRLKRFEFIGRLLAQSLLDNRMLDLPLASAFFKWLIGEEETLGMEDYEALEPTMFNSLRSMAQMEEDEFEELEVYFTYPGEEAIELMKNGKNVRVTKANCKQYIELVCYWRLVEGVRAEMEAVRRGFQTVVNKDCLRIFSSDEMELLFCGSVDNDEKIWCKSALQNAIRPDHGYTRDSNQIHWLVDMLVAYPKEKRRRFLQFVSGSPRLPFGGFRGLVPALTVVKKTASTVNNEDELPSAMTCYNYLKIPPYESYQTFIDRFEVALQHVYSFYLT